ncbi:MAG: hypothetical protein IOC52_10440 [Methylobacterium sp.]|jgi:hypothetical protein|nr:hypothetical protein [Methylobacterium sp.]
MFTRGSRYEPIAEAEFQGAEGRLIRYKRIRFLPAAGGAPGATVTDPDRPDLLAWRIAQDPEAFWRLCDANGIDSPPDLTARPGRRIKLPGPGGGA